MRVKRYVFSRIKNNIMIRERHLTTDATQHLPCSCLQIISSPNRTLITKIGTVENVSQVSLNIHNLFPIPS